MAFSLFAFGGYAQVKDKDKLETISVDIVKPYTPTIADVHKDREETPKKDSVTVAKKKVTYTTHSVPVASTFVPEKGKAVRMSVSSVRDTLYQSYAALAWGTMRHFLPMPLWLYLSVIRTIFLWTSTIIPPVEISKGLLWITILPIPNSKQGIILYRRNISGGYRPMYNTVCYIGMG